MKKKCKSTTCASFELCKYEENEYSHTCFTGLTYLELERGKERVASSCLRLKVTNTSNFLYSAIYDDMLF